MAVLKRLAKSFPSSMLFTLILSYVISSFHWHSTCDLDSFLLSGRQAAAGANAYATRIGDHAVPDPNLNPPPSLLLFEPMAKIPPPMVLWAWRGATILLWVVVILMIHRELPGVLTPHRWLWAFASVGLWSTVVQGQIYVLLSLLTTGGWLLLRRERPLLAGLLIGTAVAIKPNLAVVPALLLWAGYGRAALGAALACSALGLVAAVRYGVGSYVHWWQLAQTVPYAAAPGNSSLVAAIARLGIAPEVRYGAAALSLLLLSLWAWRTRPDPTRTMLVGLCGSFVASPIAWPGLVAVLVPILAGLPWTLPLAVVATMLTVPALVAHWPGMASFYMWPMLIATGWAMRSSAASPQSTLMGRPQARAPEPTEAIDARDGA